MVIQSYGDSIIAAFGVPFQNKNNASHAAEAAMNLKSTLEFLNSLLKTDSLPSIFFNASIVTGMVTTGALGPILNRTYQVMGGTYRL